MSRKFTDSAQKTLEIWQNIKSILFKIPLWQEKHVKTSKRNC